jgi:hypothetical protein
MNLDDQPIRPAATAARETGATNSHLPSRGWDRDDRQMAELLKRVRR